jgi:hypothetical protein
MKKVEVKSQQFNITTFERVGDMRTEVIDVVNNILFQGCKNIMEVRKVYESFWNDMGQNKNTSIKVMVKSVDLIEK